MKKLILSLFVLLVGIINFGYCLDLSRDTFDIDGCTTISAGTNFWANNNCITMLYLSGDSNHTRMFSARHLYLFDYDLDVCSDYPDECTLNTWRNFNSLVYDSSKCQTEYNLIPIENVDINYCVQNDLCPVSTGSWSELKINNIVHEGKPLINIDIPDYIFWDYSTDENQFDLYVGSGYDQEYIDNILKINSYHPDSNDFTDIFVSGLTLIFPYIVITLFIVFVWKLLKRIFK